MSLNFCANLGFLFKEVSFLDRYGAAARAGLLLQLLLSYLHITIVTRVIVVIGFSGVECGVDIYQYAIDDLKVARETAGVEQVHINAPTGEQFDKFDIVILLLGLLQEKKQEIVALLPYLVAKVIFMNHY